MAKRGKSVTKSKGKSVSKIRKSQKERIRSLPPFPSKQVRESDPDWEWVQINIKTMDQARFYARRYDIPIGKQRVVDYKQQIYRAMQKKIKIEKHDVDSVKVESMPDSTLITVRDEVANRKIVIGDANPNPVAEVEVEDLGTIIMIKGTTPAGDKQQTVVEVLPPAGEMIDVKPQVQAQVSVVKQTTQEHVILGKNDFIYPNTKFLPPKAKPKKSRLIKGKKVRKSWKEYEQHQKEQRKIVNQYKKNNLIPFLYPKGSKKFVPLKFFREMKEYDVILEKPPSKEKEKELNKSGKTFTTTRGNKIQTQIYTAKQGDKKGRFVGLFTQDDAKPTPDNPFPTISKIKKDGGEIYVDNDDTGHFVAYYINMYSFNDPFTKNVWFKDKKEIGRAENIRANKFLAKSILNTLGLRQNQALADVFKTSLGKSALRYRLEGEPTDLMPSEQILRISRVVYDEMIETNIEVSTLTDKFTFKGEIESFNEAKPILFFVSHDTEKGRRLDSDLLLRGIVKRFNIEPDSSQALLESLYDRGWISYPRIEGGEEIESSVELLRPIDDDKEFNKKFKQSLIDEGKDKGFFKGTTQETQILQMIKNAEESKDESFIQAGEWILQSGDEKWVTEGLWIAGDKKKFTDDEFDIVIANRGISPENLTEKLITNHIGTPATRTAQLSRLKNAGVIQLVKDRYLVDTRGLYFVSATQLLEEKDIPLVLNQIELVKKATTVNELVDIINDIILIDRDKFGDEIKVRAEELIEAESDLAYLDSF